MKIIVTFIAFTFCVVRFTCAGSLDYLSNQNASFGFNAAQTASTSGGSSIIPYNPAGTALLEPGYYFDLGNQTILKFYDESEDSLLNDSFAQDEPTFFLPSFGFVGNFGAVGTGRLSAYVNAGVCAGGGTLNWSDGTIGTTALAGSTAVSIATTLSGGGLATTPTGTSSSMEASSVYYGIGAGLGYALFDDKVAVSAGVRYVIARRSAVLDGTLSLNSAALGGAWTIDFTCDYEYEATGFTPIFGLDVRPVEGLTLGVRYEMETTLDFDYSINQASAVSSSAAGPATAAAVGLATNLAALVPAEATQNLPSILSVGLEYAFTPSLTVSMMTAIYFVGDMDYDGLEDYFDTGFEVALGVQYTVNERLSLGASCMYTDQGAKDSLYEASANLLSVSANPPLDSLNFSLGGRYEIIRNLHILLAGGYIYYFPHTATTVSGLEVTYEKQIVNIYAGVSYRL